MNSITGLGICIKDETTSGKEADMMITELLHEGRVEGTVWRAKFKTISLSEQRFHLVHVLRIVTL